MKNFVILFLVLFSNASFAQTTRRIVKDLDHDGKKDTISIDSDRDILICRLSSQKFKKVLSKEIRYLNFGNTLVSTKRGFEFWNDYGRSGFISVFEYNKKEHKMQLVQMKRTDYGFDSSYPGHSSVNLLTHKYTGQFYQMHHQKVVKMPVIYAEMVFPPTHLETYSDAINFDQEAKCLALYEKYKTK